MGISEQPDEAGAHSMLAIITAEVMRASAVSKAYNWRVLLHVWMVLGRPLRELTKLGLASFGLFFLDGFFESQRQPCKFRNHYKYVE